jgi:hypothetical protein
VETCLEIYGPEDSSYFIKITSEDERRSWFDAINDRVHVLAKTKEKLPPGYRNFRYRFSHGGIYEGQWFEGKMHGKGVFTFPNGNVYDGNWANNKMEGLGKFIYVNGDVYEGSWSDNLQST